MIQNKSKLFFPEFLDLVIKSITESKSNETKKKLKWIKLSFFENFWIMSPNHWKSTTVQIYIDVVVGNISANKKVSTLIQMSFPSIKCIWKV